MVPTAGVLASGVLVGLGIFLGSSQLATGIFMVGLIAAICFGICATLDHEVERGPDDSQRWRRYVVAGLVFGVLGVVMAVWSPLGLSDRVMSVVLAAAVTALMSGIIIKRHTLPLGIAIRAAYEKRLFDERQLRRRLRGPNGETLARGYWDEVNRRREAERQSQQRGNRGLV